MRQFVRRSLTAHRGVALTAVLGLALALTMALPASAGAVDNWGDSVGSSCYYDGKEYSNGSVIKQDNGNYYKCDNGTWVFDRSGIYVGPARDRFVEPVDEAPAVLAP